ncbi:MAG TPA: hypothetical protein VF432_19225 [Thermoanaerobaculia bacterium]
MTFTLLGHDAPSGRYPAAVVPVGEREGKLVAVFSSKNGNVIEEAVAPEAKFVRHQREAQDRLRYFNAATSALFAFDERDVVSYPIAGEQRFFESLLTEPKFEHADPYLRLALALETGYDDLVGPELVRAVAALVENARPFLTSWYEQTAVRLATHGFRLADWNLERVLLLTERKQLPRSARAILQESRRVELWLATTVERMQMVIREDRAGDKVAQLGELLEALSEAQSGHTMPWVDRALSGAADLEEKSARTEITERRVPRLRDLTRRAQEIGTAHLHTRRHELETMRRNAEREADEFERALHDAWLADLELARTRATKRVASIVDDWRLDAGAGFFVWSREKVLRSASQMVQTASNAVREEVDLFFREPDRWRFDHKLFPNLSELLGQRRDSQWYIDESRHRFARSMPFTEIHLRSPIRREIVELIEPSLSDALLFSVVAANTVVFASRARIEMAIKHALLEGAGVTPGYRRAIDEWSRAAAREIGHSIAVARAEWQAQIKKQDDNLDRELLTYLDELARIRDETQRMRQPE